METGDTKHISIICEKLTNICIHDLQKKSIIFFSLTDTALIGHSLNSIYLYSYYSDLSDMILLQKRMKLLIEK